MSGWRRFWIMLAGVAATTAACQPLPHPFEDDKPPADLVKMRDVGSVSIAPVAGQPQPVAAKLGGALAKALQQRDIPASDRTVSLGSYQLYGRVFAKPSDSKSKKPTEAGGQSITALWRLYAPNGKTVAERTITADAATGDWEKASDAVVEKLATASADKLASLLLDEGPKEASVDASAGRTRVAVGKITGAPGDGGDALATAISAVLKRQEVAIVGDKDKTDLRLDGQVTVDPAKGNKQHVKLVWRVRRADGAEIGTVGQENDVPKGTLDGPWGDLAYNIAIAANDGLMQVIARGAPEPAATPPSRRAEDQPRR